MDHHAPEGQRKHHMGNVRLVSDNIDVMDDFQTLKCRLQILDFPTLSGNRDFLVDTSRFKNGPSRTRGPTYASYGPYATAE